MLLFTAEQLSLSTAASSSKEVSDTINQLSESVGQLLIDQKLSITTAESCTGGLVAAALTAISGSSAYFGSGIISYSNESKRRLLGVPAAQLATHGAVSEAVVLAMADGARQRNHAQVSVAVSGIAGPDGGSANKPVGTVWIAWSVPVQNRTHLKAQRFIFSGDRNAIQRGAVLESLRGIIALLSTHEMT